MARNRTGIDGQEPLVGQVYLRHHMTAATHTLAFQAAINALPVAGGEIILDDMNYTPTVASLSAGARKIRWTGNGTVNGAALWGLPGQQVSYRPSLGREIRYQANGAAGDFAMFDWRRVANYTGGLGGSLDYILRLETTVGANVGSSGERKAEKPFITTVTNNSPHANAIGAMVQAVANNQGAIWSLEANSYSTVVPTVYAHRTIEANMQGVGDDPNDLRWIIDVLAHRAEGSGYGGDGVNVIGRGVTIQPASADFTYGLHISEGVGAGSARGTFRAAGMLIQRYSAGDMAQLLNNVSGSIFKMASGLSTNGTTMAQLVMQARNSASALKNYASLRGLIVDNSSGSEDGRFDFYAMIAGTERLVATIGGQTRLFNLPVYANEAAAVVGGLTTGTEYMTATGERRIKL